MIIKPFDEVEIKAQPIGSIVEKKYRLTRDKNGNSIYKEVSEVNVREYVHSFTMGCSLRDLLQRCSLMPAVEKLRQVNQNMDGVNLDLSLLPKDLTEAICSLQKVSHDHPDILERFSNGESFDSIIKSFVENSSVKNTESEVIENGKE